MSGQVFGEIETKFVQKYHWQVWTKLLTAQAKSSCMNISFFKEFRRFFSWLCGACPYFAKWFLFLSIHYSFFLFYLFYNIVCLHCSFFSFSPVLSFDSHLTLCSLAGTVLWSLSLLKANERTPFKMNGVTSSQRLLKLLGTIGVLAWNDGGCNRLIIKSIVNYDCCS